MLLFLVYITQAVVTVAEMVSHFVDSW